MTHIIRAALQLVRPYSSLLAFLSVLVAVYSRTHELSASLLKSIPLLFIGMCAFIINDLDDVEKDRINHPERPLPSGQVRPAFVAVLYFVCLAAALFSIRFGIGGTTNGSFLYYFLLIMSISYSYVVEYLPSIKPIYVASATAIPVLIMVQYSPREFSLYQVSVAVFLFVLGREVCKDLLDRAGDPISFLHSIAPQRLAIGSFASQTAGLLLVSLQIKGLFGFLDVLLMTALLVLASFCWFRFGRLKTATNIMKAIIFLGLYFLIE